MSINSIDSSKIQDIAGAKVKTAGASKSSDDYSLFLNEGGTSDVGDSLEKTSDTDKTEAEKELEAKQKEEEEKKKIREEITRLQKKLNDIKSRMMTMEDGDAKDKLKSEAESIESQISELEAKLNGGKSSDSAQDQSAAPAQTSTAMPSVSMPQSSGGASAPVSGGSSGGSAASGLSNALSTAAQAAAGLMSGMASAAGNSGRASSAGGNSGVSGASNPFSAGGSSNANSAAATPGAMNSVMSKAKDSNQSWGDYWKEAGYNEAAGQKLAQAGVEKGASMNTRNKCATGVARAFNSVYGTNLHGNGCDWDENMRTQSNFKEIDTSNMSKAELKEMIQNLPAGAVVCWENFNAGTSSAFAQYGHVTIADGNGNEMSDHKRKILTCYIDSANFTNDKCAIFIPTA